MKRFLLGVLIQAVCASVFWAAARYLSWNFVSNHLVTKSNVKVGDFIETYYKHDILIIAGVSLAVSFIWFIYASFAKIKSPKDRHSIRGVWIFSWVCTLICPLIFVWIHIRVFLKTGAEEWNWLVAAALYVFLSVLIFYVATFFSAPLAHKYAPIFSRTLRKF